MRALTALARFEDAARLQRDFGELCAAVHEALPLMNTPKIESAEEKAEAQRREETIQARIAQSGDPTAALRHAMIRPSTATVVAFNETDWRLPMLSDATDASTKKNQ